MNETATVKSDQVPNGGTTLWLNGTKLSLEVLPFSFWHNLVLGLLHFLFVSMFFFFIHSLDYECVNMIYWVKIDPHATLCLLCQSYF